ncbi:hypothetical protein JCM18899A_02570 [Nocardioides sp. AN3]
MVSATALIDAVWAINARGDARGGVQDVHSARDRDHDLVTAKWSRAEEAWNRVDRSEDEIAADLLEQLELA